MPRLTFHLLGSPRIELDGAPIEVDTRKAIALAVYLAVTGELHSRERLAALFWPDADEAKAHAALRRTLSVLNKALDGEGLRIERETVNLETGAAWVDVAEFHRRLADCRAHGHPPHDPCPDCLQPLSEAVTLYHDDFLAGFTLRDSSAFDDWQFFQSETLRRELAGALERLARCHLAQREYEPAITPIVDRRARYEMAVPATTQPRRVPQGPQMAKVMPGSCVFTNSVRPSGAKQAPANSLGPWALRARR